MCWPVTSLPQQGFVQAWSPPAPLQEGCGEDGCFWQSKVLPPPLASAKVFPAPGDRTVWAFLFQSSGSPEPLSPTYLKELAFPNGPSTTLARPGAPPGGWCGDSGRDSVVKDVTNPAWAGQLASSVGAGHRGCVVTKHLAPVPLTLVTPGWIPRRRRS